ncbi:MAG TPA: signal peptidase II [Acidobacteriaceae bacterium]|nr:signal peptidase II [Acidobacteriaceae bacterium]HUB19570.1 signal peptidase II [Acidobacteriaceae bacterium]
MSGPAGRDRRPWLLGISALIVVLDRLTKFWVSRHIEEGDAIVVIRHVFRLTHVRNPGAAFSMFVESPRPELTRWILAGFSLVAATVVLWIILRFGRRLTPTMVALALILGGTIGNAWDRVRTGLVTDFLEVHIIHYHWPDFNVADSAIVVGGILLVLDALRSSPKEPSA